MATHSSIPAWRSPWTEQSGGLRSIGVGRSQTRLSDFTFYHTKQILYDSADMRSQNSQIHERQSRTEVARGRDEQGMGSRLMGTVSIFRDGGGSGDGGWGRLQQCERLMPKAISQ